MATGSEGDPAQGDFERLKRIRSSQLGQLSRLYRELEQKMVSHENEKTVQELYIKLGERFELFKSAHLQCLDECMDSDKVTTLELNYESCRQNFDEFQERFTQWKSACLTPDDDDDDDVRTTVSSASSMSIRSKLKSAKAKRLIAEHKLKSLKTKRELERARKEIENKQQELECRCDLEEAQIEETVWQQALAEENRVAADDNLSQEKEDENKSFDNSDSESEIIFTKERDASRSSNTKTNINSNSKSYEGRSKIRTARDHSDPDENTQNFLKDRHSAENTTNNSEMIDSAFQKLASALHEGFNLPKPELLTFSGKSTEYCKFIKNFETNIECKVCDYSQRLSYLIQYCFGEAKSSIEDCVLLEPEVGYRQARDILFSRYGRPHVIARTYIDNLVNGPQISAADVDSLSQLALEMQKCEITLSQLGFTCDKDNTENLRRIVKRLPRHLRTKWTDIAHGINEAGSEARFSDLAKFVDQKARVANSMYGMDLARESRSTKSGLNQTSGRQFFTKPAHGVTTLTTQSKYNEKKYERKCRCCYGKCTDLHSCDKFKTMNLTDRNGLVKKYKLCFNCLKGNHTSRDCRKPKLCTVPECPLKHSMLLHSWSEPPTALSVTQSFNCAAVDNAFTKNCLGIVPVIVKSKNGVQYQTYALLDDGADKTLCDERLIRALHLKSKPVMFQISTVSSTNTTNCGQEVDITVCSVNGTGSEDIPLRKVWSVKNLPISSRSAAVNDDIKTLPYLSDINIPQVENKDVMLLIGTDNPAAHIPLEVRSGNCGQPYAVRSRLGWAIRGPVEDKTKSSTINVHFEQSRDTLLQEQLEKMWNTDFNDRIVNEKDSMSIEDKSALKIMESTLIHKHGHYTMGLPWRQDVSLPNNMPLAQVRLQHLKNKLSRDAALHQMYSATMNDYIQKGYATKVPETDKSSKRVWYLPHHPVTNVNKPGKVRVVFDCAAKYKGVSLNSQLLQGPDFMNSLVGVLVRFRKERIALAADIEAMFHQVRVTREDSEALRFLWWPNGDLNQRPKCYRMQVHLFGATSSPSCTAYALKRTAVDNADDFEPEVVSTVQRNFYVDDCLKSVETEQKAIKLAADLQAMMKLGGFRLTKWLSNSKNVLNAIPESEHAPSAVNMKLDDTSTCDRALGVLWNAKEDKICFKVKVEEKPLTRRGILSVVSSIYDPIGLVAPVTLQAKSIVQSLCRLKIGWDDQIPNILRHEWHTWLSTLPSMETVSVNRCYRPRDLGKIKNTQLHIFSDGSERGYGACAYLRFVDINDNIHCSLVMGKSRLAPIKQISIPRLELSGAVVGCRLYAMINEEIDIKFDNITFWTDSTIVLGYIRNTSKRFKTFVGNRLSIIHEATSLDKWRYVDTSSNPADIASRGLRADDTKKLQMWHNGPGFLWQNSEKWPHNPCVPEVDDDDNEVKREITINTTSVADCMGNFIDRFSSWTRLKRAFAWLLRYTMYCRQKYLNHNVKFETGNLTLQEIQDAEHDILVHVQRTNFPNEIERLRHMKPVKKDSSIASLNPMIYDELIRVQGRSQPRNPNSFPVILPNGHTVTRLIIRHLHENNGHAGKQHILALSRDKYWILRGQSAVKSVLRNCIVCRRQHAPLLTQQMAPLLKEQTTPDDPPFTNIGIDYFGPFIVKSDRKHVKRYGCIFTCLATRAVHLEVTHSLTTDSFISAFQRFTSRRGYPKTVFSDNGTNIVSGDRQLKTSLKEWNNTKVQKYMVGQEIDWHFNPPQASHRGGAWERLIRSTRTILAALVKQQLLTDEQLLTLIAEAEKILNDRPITPVSEHKDDLRALTPNTLLLMRSTGSIPRGVFNKTDLYSKRWWKQVQYLANIFWRRWIREYIPTLQNRPKWQRSTTDVRVGDIVLVSNYNSPRGHWPLGRVVEIRESRDGHIRSCVVKYKNTQTVKPITKLCLLESSA